MTSYHDVGEVIYNEPPFRQIPDSLVFHDEILDVDVRLFHVLVWCARGGKGAFPGRKKLAELIKKKSERTVDASLERLRVNGFLTVRPRYNDKGARISNLYVLHHTPLPAAKRQTDLIKDTKKPDNPPATDCEGAQETRSNELRGAVATSCQEPSQKTAHIRDTKKKRHQEEEKEDHLLAVGELTRRNARETAQTPSANKIDLSRMAGDVLGQMPDHYRRAPAWLRTRLLNKLGDALADFAPMAIVTYAHKFAFDPNFGDYEHLRRFSDVLHKLADDIADGTACPGCGCDPNHAFCSADVRTS